LKQAQNKLLLLLFGVCRAIDCEKENHNSGFENTLYLQKKTFLQQVAKINQNNQPHPVSENTEMSALAQELV
jgi:hypothetical protein